MALNKLKPKDVVLKVFDKVFNQMFVSRFLNTYIQNIQALGYGIIAVTFGLQPLLKWACDRLTGFWRLACFDAFLFLGFVGTVNVWRGLWAILDIYFIPGK